MATGDRFSIACPHCCAKTRVRSSRTIASTFKQLHLQCTNLECGATYGGALSITHQISASAMPCAAVNLRMAPPRRLAAANDDGVHHGARGPEVPLPAPANDDTTCAEAAAQG